MDIILVIGKYLFFILLLALLFNFSLMLIYYCIKLFGKKEMKYDPNFKPNVSIIIPFYNEEQNISLCLKNISMSAYSLDKIELVLVDDGSTDDSVKIINAFKKSSVGKKFKSINLLSEKRGGKVDALNKGIAFSTSEIILTLDADTHIDFDFMKQIVVPFKDKAVGLVSGTVKVHNPKGIIQSYQCLDYAQNNMIRIIFSRIFGHGVWFFGCVSCFRKSALSRVGYFKKRTVAEDMDISMDLNTSGYKTVSCEDAIAYTDVPGTSVGLVKQRIRWWQGGLQSLFVNRKLISKSSFPIKYIFINQIWWSVYSLFAFPILLYQIYYWLPHTGVIETLSYFFRWFSLLGPIYVLYKIPEWGLNLNNIFGVISGLVSSTMLIVAAIKFREKILRTALSIFFYFPYSLIITISIIIGTFKAIFIREKTGFFKK